MTRDPVPTPAEALERLVAAMESPNHLHTRLCTLSDKQHAALAEARAALASQPAADLDVERLIRAVELSRNHDLNPSHQSPNLCSCMMDALLYAQNYRDAKP